MSRTPEVPSKIADYLVLPLALPPLPSLPTPATHYLYLHPHTPKIPSPTTSRSLFLVNIPFDATPEHLKYLFSTQLSLPAGRIEDVHFEDTNKRSSDITPPAQKVPIKKNKKRKRGEQEIAQGLAAAEWPRVWDRKLHASGSNAVVVFVDRTSIEAVIKAVKRVQKGKERIVWGEGVEDKLPPLGYQRYLTHHNLSFPPRATLLETINSYMTAYASLESERARALARKRQEPDEDGFVTVTRGGRTGPARMEEAAEKLDKQKERQKGLDDFYRFQGREKRKERETQLRRKFEGDREKVRRMREARGAFKPER